MQPFTTLEATAVALPADNIDTDQILPGRFLKTLERRGLGDALFHNMRWLANGTPDPDFVLNMPTATRASILVGGINFGCGSSRGACALGVARFRIPGGDRTGFADIFYNNSVNCGLLPAIVAPEAWPISSRRQTARPC